VQRLIGKKQRILVTGGAGFIGSTLIPMLLEKKHSVVVFDNLISGKLENLGKYVSHPELVFVKGDIRDKTLLNEALGQIDAVVHLAALIDVSESVRNPYETNEVNVTGTLNTLQMSANKKIKKFVFASSTAVYGDAKNLPVKEETRTNPISPYAASKAAGEAYCNAISTCYNINAIVLRFFNVYGPKNENSPYSGVITKFIQKAQRNDPLTVEGDGTQTRDFINVKDVAQALLLSVEAENLTQETINVCTGNPTSVNLLAEYIKSITGKQLTVTHISPRVGDIKHSYGDPNKAKLKLGFEAKVTLNEGLRNLFENNY
jgi:UDP-glucose 4-epimerase